MWFALRYLYLPAVVLCLERPRVENVEAIQERFHFRRAVDGTRGRKYFDPVTDGLYDSYGSAGGNYDPEQEKSGFSDIRSNVPGEPGVSYPTYTNVPRTSFSCAGRNQGYYADEESGCQAFYVCNSVAVASFICPVGSVFSQALLTCDWWNKVNCGMTESYASFRQQNYNNENEMIQKAYTMMQPPDQNVIKSDQKTGPRRRVKIKRVRVQPNDASDFATTGDRGTQNYNNLQTSQPQVQENYPFGRNDFVTNRRPQKDMMNVHVEPQDFVVNDQEQGLILNSPAEDSSIIYIQKNDDGNPQDGYTPPGLSTFENNFQNYYQQGVNDFGNQFKPSYAPTVPTVTTTTRRFYSPTVPTPYRPSTISYDNYDQNLEGSRHIYANNNGEINLLTTPQTITYKDADLEDLQNPANGQSDQSNGFGDEGIQEPENPAENVQPAVEPAALEQNNDGRDVENIQTQSRSGFQSEQRAVEGSDSVLVDRETPVLSETGTVVDENKKNINTFDSFSDVSPLFAQIPRPMRPPGRPVIDIADQLLTFESFNKKPQSIQSSQPASSESVGAPVINFRSAQTFQPDSRTPLSTLSTVQSMSASSEEDQRLSGVGEVNTSDVSAAVPLIPQLAQPAISSEIQSPGGSNDIIRLSRMDIVDALPHTQTFEPATRIPLIVTQDTQPPASSGIQSPGKTNDNNHISQAPPRITSFISQTPQSSASPETQSSEASEDKYHSEVFKNTPSLILQAPKLAPSSGIEIQGKANDDNITRAPRRIPALITQILRSLTSLGPRSSAVGNNRNSFDIFARKSLLIRQAPQLTSSSEVQDVNDANVDGNLDVLTIPALIPQTSETIRPSEMGSIDTPIYREILEIDTRIPPLILPTSQTIIPSQTESPSVINDNSNTRVPPLISALIPQIPQSSLSSGSVASNNQNALDVSTRIPPLIPQPAQSASSSGGQDQSEIYLNTTIDVPSIPPLISSTSQTNPPSQIDSIDPPIQTQTPETSTRIPPLILTTSQSIIPLQTESPSVITDGEIIRVPPLISALIPQTPQTPQSSPSPGSVANNNQNAIDALPKVPPLIPQATQSASSSGVQDPIPIIVSTNVDVPSVPLLIPSSSQTMRPLPMDSTDTLIETQTPQPPTTLPPFIPPNSQSITPSETESPSSTDNDSITETPPSMTASIPQTPRAPPRISSLFPQSSRVPPMIPSSIPPTTQSSISSETQSPDDSNNTLVPSVPTRLPPLIPQSSPSASSSGVQSSSETNDESNLDVGARPLLLPLIPDGIGPVRMDSMDTLIDTQTSESVTMIPPTIPQTLQPQTSTETSFLEDTSNGPIPNIPTGQILPLIPQSSQSGSSSGMESSSGVDDQNTFGVPTILPLFPEIPQSVEPGRMDSTNVVDRTKISGTATKIPLLIPQVPQTAVPLDVQSTEGTGNQNQAPSGTPSLAPRIPPFSTSSGSPFGVDDGKQFSDIPSEMPPRINQVSIPLASLGSQSTDIFSERNISFPSIFDFNYELRSFNPLADTMPATIVRFRGRYQDPSPFIQFQAPTGLPGHQFVIGPTTDKAVYDFYRDRGSTLNIGIKALSPLVNSERSTAQRFDTNVPDLSSINERNSKDTFVRSTVGNYNLPNTNSPKTPSYSSTTVNIGNTASLSKLNQTNRFPFGVSTTNQSQSKLFDRPSSVFNSFSTKFSDPFFTLNTKNVATSTPTQPKAPTFAPFTSNFESGRFNSFKQAERPIGGESTTVKLPSTPTQPKAPTSTPYTFNSDSSRFSSFKQAEAPIGEESTTVKLPSTPTQPKAPTSTPFTFDFDSSRFSSFKQAGGPIAEESTTVKLPSTPTQPKAPTSTPFTFNSDSSRFSSFEQAGNPIGEESTTVKLPSFPAQPKTPTSTPFTSNFDASRFSSFKQAARPIAEESKSVKLPSFPTQPKAPTSTPFTSNFVRSRFSSFNQAARPIAETSTTVRLPSTPTQPRVPTSTPFNLNYSSFKQAERPNGENPTTVKTPENNNDLQFTIRGALRKNSAVASSQPKSPPSRFGNSKEWFGSSTPKNIVGIGGLRNTPENPREIKTESPKVFQTSTLPPELPESLSQFETVASLGNEAPYEVRFTVNADEDFNPSADFISKLLAEHVDEGGLAGYEIVRSDSPDGSDEGKDTKLISAPNIQPTVGLSTLPSTSSANPVGSQRNYQSGYYLHNSNRPIANTQTVKNPHTRIESGFSPYNSNRDTPNPQTNSNPITNLELINSDVLPRPFFGGNQPNVVPQANINARFNDFIANPSSFESNTRYTKLRNGLDYSKMRVNPTDINGSLKSLFELSPNVPESSQPHTKQILEELKKQFGEPLYNSNSQSSFISSDGARSVEHRPRQQFVNLQQYRVRSNQAPAQQQPLTSPEPPKTTTTTTTTTPEPVKTFVETEFIPSLGFSFDYDEGRKQYVEAILQGLLTEDQSTDSFDDAADSKEESNQN